MSHAALLSEVSLFAGLEDEALESLSALLRPRRFARGEVVFHQGDVGTSLFIIRRGEIDIRLSSPDGKEVILSLLGRGDFFGELALLDGEPRSTDAVAREESELLTLQREDFRRFLETRPGVSLGLLATLSQMVRHVTQLVHDTHFLDARERLVRVLLDLGREQGVHGPGGVVIPCNLTQTDLANLCGLTRESTNKWLRFYVREGLLSYEGGVITLVHPERLGRETP
ncbi:MULTISPECIES: Crp/Fnr family transcriptional regulator [unclassified Myxococcus]|uniref:Crp/Fnr family transcriptional regulator n=1 Tax=unclassified Myxococcus TaxID=2648731 RepID=UPI00157B231D|nr:MULTISPECIES: Crp/Fnr family transcriptional regulator [unclassified Myxococcus]NTX06823.1 Crp/Fnr family transcriptional regulator [Myxococcus sp. CA040A]NTX13868.1 Crp/Fnr family transcriptional regulator [Myxococcus sp. CA056]